MAKRVTILIDDELDRGVREHRAGMAPLKRNKAYSYSAAVNDLLAKTSDWRHPCIPRLAVRRPG